MKVFCTGMFFTIVVHFCYSIFHCSGPIFMVRSNLFFVYIPKYNITFLKVSKLKSFRSKFTCSYGILV